MVVGDRHRDLGVPSCSARVSGSYESDGVTVGEEKGHTEEEEQGGENHEGQMSFQAAAALQPI